MGDYVDNQAVYLLPDELLLQIFSHLSLQELGRAARVCKRWWRVSYDPSFYESAELSRASYEPGTLGFILERGAEHLTIRGQANDAAFQEKPFLGEMDPGTSYSLKQLYNSSLREGVHLILQRCHHLTDIRLVMQSMNRPLMQSLAELRNLIHLRIITHNRGPSFEETVAIARGNRRLRVFNCHGYANTLNDSKISELIKELPLTIEETNLFSSSECLSDQHVAKMAHRLSNLVELHLQHCPKLTGQSFRNLRVLRRLEKLNFTIFQNFHINGFWHLNHMKSMKTLALFGSCEYFFLCELQDLLPNLNVTNQVYLSMYCANRR